MVFDSDFAALVIIDKLDENLETVLASRFQFPVEVLELARYESDNGDRQYLFEPFLADVESDVPALEIADIDCVVVPARADGMEETFLGEDRWYQVRMSATMRPQVKYIAAYQVAPISAITHFAPVRSIETWKDSGKVVLNFAEPAVEIGPIPIVRGGRVTALQNLRYTSMSRLLVAETLEDVW